MHKTYMVLIALIFLTGCFAFVENKEGVSRVKSFGITDDEALDLLDKAESIKPVQKKEFRFFHGQ